MLPNLHIREAGLEDIETIISLAEAIWPQTYKDILKPDQLQYMMNLFYSAASLKDQMQVHRFLLLEEDKIQLGFSSYSGMPGRPSVKLHKIYVMTGLQGKGLGRFMIASILERIRITGATSLVLNVNRFNKAKQFYERLGFTVVGEEDIDIGNNYFMNDYVMEFCF